MYAESIDILKKILEQYNTDLELDETILKNNRNSIEVLEEKISKSRNIVVQLRTIIKDLERKTE